MSQGTLTPIVKVPSHAIPTERTRKAITKIASDPQNVVYLISGRDGDFLLEHWGSVDGLGLSAEHGSFVKAPDADEFANMTETLDMSWMSEVEEIFRYYMEVSPGYRNRIPDSTDGYCSAQREVRLKSRKRLLRGTTGTRIPTLGGSWICGEWS